MQPSFVHSWVRTALPIGLVIALVSAAACSDATGSLEGGQAIIVANEGGTSGSGMSGSTSGSTSGSGTSEAGSCPPGGTPTFSELYACYFTTCGVAGCHGTPIDDGAVISGFVCGTSASDCAMGMMTSVVTGTVPIVPTGGAKDATTTGLYSALNKGGTVGGASNNMPVLPVIVFSQADLAAIEAWIQGGAPNN